MLLGMMGRARAHGPAIGRLKPNAAVGAGADVGTFDGHVETTRHAAMMTPHPGAMTRALPLGGEIVLLLQSIGKPHVYASTRTKFVVGSSLTTALSRRT